MMKHIFILALLCAAVAGAAIGAGKMGLGRYQIGKVTDSNIKLLVHCSSAEFKDSSVYAKAVTLGSSSSLAGSAPTGFPNSLKVNRSANDKISFADSADWDMSASDGSVDFWVYPVTRQDGDGLVSQSSGGSDGNTGIYLYADGSVAVGRGGVNQIVTAAGYLPTNTWTHVAVTRTHSSGTTKIYINGTERASATTAVWIDSSNDLSIGYTAAHIFDGYITEIRWSKGVNQFPSAFTVPSRPYGY
jgi:hypothetical protein